MGENEVIAAPGDFSFIRAARERCFVQLPLVELAALRNAAKERGLSDFGLFERNAWETLDREGLLVPVAYARHHLWEHQLHACLEDGDFRVREGVGHIPWDQLRADAEAVHGDYANVQVLYHHWQVLALAELQHWLAPSMPWSNLGGGLESFYASRAQIAAAPDVLPREQLLSMAAEHRARELLLVSVQNMLWPGERGDPGHSRWRGGFVGGLTEDATEWASELLRTTDIAHLAADCGVSADELAVVYDGLARRGLRLDPNAAMVDLLDQIGRSRRERLTGAARLAVDYYDAARLIRGWHHLATGAEVWLPDVDELRGINGTRFKRSRFGTLEVRGNRAVLPTLLEDYGLYPWRVQLIAEGESELVALRTVIEEGYGLTFARLGIAVTDMGGASIPANAERLLADLRAYVNYFLLVFDNEGRARELIDELQRAGVVEGVGDDQRKAMFAKLAEAAKQLADPEARREALKAARRRAANLHEQPGEAPEFVLWPENFEADNFTYEELCEVASDMISLGTGGAGATIDAEQLREAAAGRPESGVASILIEQLEERGVRVSKPDLAASLARYAMAHPEHQSDERPLLALAEHLVRLTGADRRLSGKLRKGR